MNTETFQPDLRERIVPRQRYTLLKIVLLVALPIRLYLALDAAMLSRDGAVYIWYAQGLQQDALAELRSQPHHPLYPAMVLGLHSFLESSQPKWPGRTVDPVRSWTQAAVAVTLIGGLAVVLGVYSLTLILFDRRVALIAALLAACTAEFCQLSADALTDMPHLAVYLFALAAGITGVRRGSYPYLALAGLLSGIAYLIRPEGAEVAVVTAVCAAWLLQPARLSRRLLVVALVCAAAALPALPYMIVTGKLIPKKPIGQLLWGPSSAEQEKNCPQINTDEHRWNTTGVSAEDIENPPFRAATVRERLAQTENHRFLTGAAPKENTPRALIRVHPCSSVVPSFPLPNEADVAIAGVTDLPRALGRIAENWARSLRVTFLLPAIGWLILRRKSEFAGDQVGRWAISAGMSLHLAILVGLLVHFDYWKLFSLRHVMILAALTLPYTAAGVATILDLIPQGRAKLTAIAMGLVLVGPTTPWMLETRHADAIAIRRAGEWIRRQQPIGARVLTTRIRAAFYANGVRVHSPLDADVAAILAQARAEHPEYLVFEIERMKKMSPDFFHELRQNALPGEIAPVFLAEGRGDTDRAIVYRYHPPQ